MFYTVTIASLHVTAHDSTIASHLACRRCRRRLHIGGVKGEGEAEEEEASFHHVSSPSRHTRTHQIEGDSHPQGMPQALNLSILHALHAARKQLW
jgi:hypothetical protein